MDDSFYYLNSNLNYYKILTSFGRVLIINSVLLLILNYIFPNFLLRNIDLLAKTILCSELIGSSNTITSIITTTQTEVANSEPQQQKQNTHGNNANSHSNSNPNSNSSNNINLNEQLRKSSSQLLNNNFLKILICFTVILTMKSINNSINFGLILKFLKVQDFNSLFSYKIFNSGYYFGNGPRYNSIYDQHYNRNPFHSEDNAYYPYSDHPHGLLTHDIFSLHQSNGLRCSKLLLFFYYELCINVITVKFNPIFSIIGLKRLSNNLDQLNNLNPNIPIDFKRNHKFKDKDESIINDNEPSIPIISLKNNFKSSRSVNISLPKAISDSKINFKTSNSISSKNFEIFCLKLFANKKLQNNSNSYPNINLSGPNANNTNPANISNNNANHFKMNKNSTLIIDKNSSIIQPIWSLLAVIKVITRNSTLFQGKLSYFKNNHEKYLADVSNFNKLPLCIKYIDDHKVLLKVLNDDIPQNLKITLNGLDWDYFRVSGDYLLIYSLSPNFQYEIELKDGDDQIFNSLIVNTISADGNALRRSPKISSLTTLKTSLKSTLENLNQIKISLKDFKREENKKLGEVRKSNEVLQDKIAKSTGNDEHNLKKIKGLKQSINQFEIEIDHLQTDLKDMTSNNDNLHELEYKKEIKEVKQFIKDYEKSVNKYKVQLKDVEDSKTQHSNKIDKLLNKQKDIESEMEHFLAETENLEHVILTKLQRKSKKINENFDTILPAVKHATMELNKELELTK